MCNVIQSQEDIQIFLNKTNSLHDGYLTKVQYTNDGISKTEQGHRFCIEKTKLHLQIVVTSMYDVVVEIAFEGVLEWQIQNGQWDIEDTTVMFDENGWIVWSDSACANVDEMRKNSYVIAKSMRWGIVQ